MHPERKGPGGGPSASPDIGERSDPVAQWVFFDIGGVLLNDDAVMASVFRHIWQSVRKKGHNLAFKELMAEREEISNRGSRLRIHHELALRYLTMEEWKATRRRYLDETLPVLEALCPAMPGMKTVVRKMRTKARLGIIANQPDEIIPVLEKHGFWEPFEVKGISEVVGLSKPDPDFYRWAIQAVVGDTIKYDLRPARRVGMKTVWFNPGAGEKRGQPRDEYERLYLKSLARQQESKREKVRRKIKPDAIAHHSGDLLAVLARLLTQE